MSNRSKRRRSPPPRRGLPVAWLLGGAGLLAIMAAVILLTRPGSNGQTPAAEAGDQAGAGPRLALDREEIDFGQVPVDQMVQAEFTISNNGDQALQILEQPVVQVKEGC
jgi:hypothetical protein